MTITIIFKILKNY